MLNQQWFSIREIEVIVSVVIVFSLSDQRTNKVNGGWKPCKSEPDSATEVNNPSLDEELAGTTVKEVEQPLLGGIGSVMPDVTSSICGFLIEILFSIPCSVLHFWYSKTLSIDESHVFHVSVFVVGKTSSYNLNNNWWSGFVDNKVATIKSVSKNKYELYKFLLTWHVETYLWRPFSILNELY